MRISDWSSDVCSSDLEHRVHGAARLRHSLRGEEIMIKAVILLKRKDGMSLQDFADWLLKDHVPLALKLDGLKRYQVNIAREADGDYDGVSELWLDSEDAMLAASEIGRAPGRERVCPYV